jgi:hypothetical protein
MKNLLLTGAGLSLCLMLAPCTAAAIEISALPEIAAPGDKVTVEIKTQPGAHCRIEANDQDASQMLALKPVDADAKGHAAWTFEVAKSYKAGCLPIILTSSSGAGVDEKVMVQLKIRKLAPERMALRFTSEPKAVAPGEQITVAVQTDPGANLKIEAQDVGVGQTAALADKKADAEGRATWTFTVDETYKADKVPVIITEQLGDGEKKLVCTIPLRRSL